MGICYKMGETLEGEPGFGRFDYCFHGPYARTETIPAAASRYIKRLTCSLMNSIARTLTWIWRELEEMSWSIQFGHVTNYLCDMTDNYLWKSLHPRFTWCLLTLVEKFQFRFTYLTAPFALHIFYMLFRPDNDSTDPSTRTTLASFLPSFSNFTFPTPHWSNFDTSAFQSLSTCQWILFLLACAWAILTLVWLVLNAWYWKSRCKIKGFTMYYIYGMQIRTLFIGFYLSYLMLVKLPQLALQGYLFASYYFIWALVLSFMSLMQRFQGYGYWKDEDLLSEIDTSEMFGEQDAADLHNAYNQKYPAIPLDDLNSSDRSTGSTGDAPETQSPSDGNNRTQTQSSSVTNDPHVEPPPPDPNVPQPPPTGSSSGNLVNRPNLEPTDSFRLRDLVQSHTDLVQSHMDLVRYLASRDSEGDSTNPH